MTQTLLIMLALSFSLPTFATGTSLVFLNSFDVVGALNNDGSQVPYSVLIPNPLVTPSNASAQPFGGLGSRFLAGAIIYPGNTFPTTGPFVNPTDHSQLYPNKIIGTWFCNGLITNDIPQVGPGLGNKPFGNSNINFRFIASDGTDESIFIQDTLKSMDVTKINTGLPARTQDASVVVGFNDNVYLAGKVKITTYLVADGLGLQFLNHYDFQYPVVVNKR